MRMVVLISPHAKTEQVIFVDGDWRAFSASAAVLSTQRWWTFMLANTPGMALSIRCKWTGAKPHIESIHQSVRTIGRVTPQWVIEPQQTGLEVWKAAAGDIEWTDWNRITLELNSDGTIRQARLVQGEGAVGEAALKSAELWKFKQSPLLPPHLTLSLAYASGKPLIMYGVLTSTAGQNRA